MSAVRITVGRTRCTFDQRFVEKPFRVVLTKDGTCTYTGPKRKASERAMYKRCLQALAAKLPKTDPLTLYLKEWPKATAQLIDYHRMLSDMLSLTK